MDASFLRALLLEAVLVVTLVSPSVVNMTLFLTAAAIGVFVFGYLWAPPVR